MISLALRHRRMPFAGVVNRKGKSSVFAIFYDNKRRDDRQTLQNHKIRCKDVLKQRNRGKEIDLVAMRGPGLSPYLHVERLLR